MPKAHAQFALRLSLPLLLICWIGPYDLLAQQSPARFTLRLNGGVAVLPLEGWDAYAANYPDSHYGHATPDIISSMTAGFKLAPGHSLSLEIEKLTSTTTVFGVQKSISPVGAELELLRVIMLNREYTGLPVSLNYTRHFMIKPDGGSSFIGVGVAYYMTEVRGTLDFLYDPQDLSSSLANLESQKSTGYGLALMAGIDFPLIGSLYLSNQLRFRWADGTAFDDPENITVSFTGYDLSIGFAWQF